ncbi:MAG: MBL fold metallo-hydrolase [Treponema sp.]|nr:MBL fold metallo-hydrolase [Treponema sp.]
MARTRRTRKSGFPTVVILAALIAAWYRFVPELAAEPPVRAEPQTVSTDFAEPVAYSGDGLLVHYIDIGQGDATLVQAPGGNILIDGGDRRTVTAFVRYLKEAGISRIAYVIATHPHADHISGLVNVLDEFEIGAVIMPRVAHTSATFERMISAIERHDIPVVEPIPGTVLNVGDVRLTILSPNGTDSKNLNNHSVSVMIGYGGTRFLFTGDSESEAEEAMLAGGLDLSAQVLHVGHHGSITSTTRDFLDAVSPQIAVVSVGAHNSYGHPNKEVIQRLETAGVTVYRTDENGTVLISSDGRLVKVH